MLFLSRVQNNENGFRGASEDPSVTVKGERDRRRGHPVDQTEKLKCGFNIPEIVNNFQFTEYILICQKTVSFR